MQSNGIRKEGQVRGREVQTSSFPQAPAAHKEGCHA
jgi:hypothetical protein